MSLFCVFVICLQIIINQCDCGQCSGSPLMKCKWTVKNDMLDLTAFQMSGTYLTGQENGFKYYFSPCNNYIIGNNSIIDNNKGYMVAITGNKGKKYLARFDGKILPTIGYNNNSDIIWHFVYNKRF
eukprot:137012_1